MDNFLNSLAGSISGTFFGGQDPFGFQQNQQFWQQAMDPQGGGNKGPPPASAKAIRQLPTVIVTPQDLIDENNRECCICLEENHLKDRVLRLPCAHIFHQHCILDWLTKHCTCPVCRYELETDDAPYERSRRARMRFRKPRVHEYELQRMSLPELQQLAQQLKIKWPKKIRDKKDILRLFETSGKIDIIAAPEPVEYGLEELRGMSIGRLKKCMEEAGVFFDSVDVVEKEDMVRIFCNSGRLVLKRNNGITRKNAYTAPQPFQEPSMDLKKSAKTEGAAEAANRTILVETVTDDDEGDCEILEGATTMFPKTTVPLSGGVTEERYIDEVTQHQPELEVEDSPVDVEFTEANDVHVDIDDVPVVVADPIERMEGGRMEGEPQDCEPSEESRAEALRPEEGQTSESNMERRQQMYDDLRRDELRQESEEMKEEPVTNNDEPLATAYARFDAYNITELRLSARRLGIDLSDCIERSEMVDKLVRANGIEECDFDGWSVSDLRAVATAVGVDLSRSEDRSDMVKELLKESKARPHVASYLSSLMPLASLTVPQLRAVAREWRVNLRDCIEKGEMVHRLVSAAKPEAVLNGVHG